jgi:RNA polymerase-binding transcription factor DksA
MWAVALLETEREQTRQRLAAVSAEFDGIVAASEGANSDDEHDPEGSTIAFERERAAALRSQAEAHLGDIDRAFVRVADGTYGTCRVCGGEIGDERLTALLVTEVCRACAGAGVPRRGVPPTRLSRRPDGS